MIYLDNAASTRARRRGAGRRWREAAAGLYANPASAHTAGRGGRRAPWRRRAARSAAALDVEPEELVFTSGGTEADALGVLGAARAARGRHLVVSALEHPAVMRGAEALVGRRAGTLDVVPPGARRRRQRRCGRRRRAPRHRGRRAHAGATTSSARVQPVADIARRLGPPGDRKRARTCTSTPCRRSASCACARARSAPTASPSRRTSCTVRAGAGALWLRPGARLAPLWVGGGQERGLRGGSENLPAMVGFGRAAALARARGAAGGAEAWVAALRDRFEQAALGALAAVVPGARPTVTGAPRAPHIASLAFPGLPAEPLLHALEARGVLASAGSACASRTRRPQPDAEGDRRRRPHRPCCASRSRATPTARRRRRRGRRPRSTPLATSLRLGPESDQPPDVAGLARRAARRAAPARRR